MNRNFEIDMEIILVLESHELDLHNVFDFKKLDYSIEERRLVLYWQRPEGSWVIRPDTPKALTIEFKGVSEFRFMPRDSEMPFTEDDCIASFGYWVDEDEFWDGGFVDESDLKLWTPPLQRAKPQWLTAIAFMSGAILAVQAESAHASIVA